MAYNYTETRLTLTGITMKQNPSHNNNGGSSTSCTSIDLFL